MKSFEFAFPGPLRDSLVAAVLAGRKTSTTGLLIDYQTAGEDLPFVGERYAMIDSAGAPVAVLEITGVRVLPLAEVDLQHALDEGEGDTSVASWRANHEKFFHSPEMRAALDDPHFTVDDTTPVVATRFRVVSENE